MKVLVYGANGWIGNQVINLFKKNNINYVIGEERVESDDDLFFEINNVQPTHILSLIGRTHGLIDDKVYSTIDYLEEEGKLLENVRDNLYSPISLAILCQELGIHFTYLGTGCIFEYKNDTYLGSGCLLDSFDINKGFTEESRPNFFGSSYSIVKGFTDMLMKKYKVLNLRIRMPITDDKNPRNFITKITNYEKICSIPNSMSVLPELLPYMIDMMKQNIIGTYNFTNPGVISHNEILEMYKEIVDPSFTWKNFTIEEQNDILSSKRSNNKLDTHKLESLFPVKNIKEAVKDCLLKYPKPEKNDFDNSEDTNILVTGGCGFIGSHFINYIWKKYDNIKIYNIDAMYYCANEDNIEKAVRESDRYTLIKMNINDLEVKLFNDFKINYVVHFAAQSHVNNSFEEPIRYVYDNVLATTTLLEATRQYGEIKKFIHVSTDEVYSQHIDNVNKKNELSLLSPTNPYSASKAGAEMMCQSYISSFKLPIVISRGNNVMGKNQYPEKLIPKFIEHLRNNEKVTIQGTGSALRSFLYVKDTIKAFDVLLQKGVIGEIYNIGTDDHMEYSVMDVAKILIKKIKNTDDYDKWIEYIPDRPWNDERYYICNNKLKNLGWSVETNFDTAIDIILKDS
jgi:dTDP-glucose 4,6-dehydratase